MNWTVPSGIIKAFSYELSEREIYNDIRSEIGKTNSETVIDDDADYSWKVWTKYSGLPAPGYTHFAYFTATQQSPISWKLVNVSAATYAKVPYYDYEIELQDTNDDLTKAVRIKNKGSSGGTIQYTVKYKYLTSEEVTHEETTETILTVRSTDEESISTYARRSMNLVWPQGATEETVQGLCDFNRNRYKDPYGYATLVLIGDTAAKREIIFKAEMSDIMTVTDAYSYLPETDFFVDSIDFDIDIERLNIPIATFGLVEQRPVETMVYFRFGSGHFGGPEVFG